jgi:hypothetical protein
MRENFPWTIDVPVADLEYFVRQVDVGPVHMVAATFGGTVAIAFDRLRRPRGSARELRRLCDGLRQSRSTILRCPLSNGRRTYVELSRQLRRNTAGTNKLDHPLAELRRIRGFGWPCRTPSSVRMRGQRKGVKSKDREAYFCDRTLVRLLSWPRPLAHWHMPTRGVIVNDHYSTGSTSNRYGRSREIRVT